MFSVQAKPAENTLAFSASDPITDGEFATVTGAIQTEARKLKPGWTAAVDLRGMKALKPEYVKVMAEVQLALKTSGAGKVGTLLASAILQTQLARASRETQTGENVRRFADEAEWRAFLEG